MEKKPGQKFDLNQLAASIVEKATDENPPKEPEQGKNKAAQELGRLGGLKGGKARAEKLTPEKERDCSEGAQARWKK